MRRLAFLLTLAFVASIPLASALSLGAIGSINKFVGFAAVGAWVAQIVTTGRVRHPASFVMAALTFMLWAQLSLVVWSEAPRTALALPMLMVMVALLWDQCRSRLDVAAALQAFVIGAFLANMSLLYNYRFGFSLQFQTRGRVGAEVFVADRFAAAGTGPNSLGVMVAAAVAIAAYLVVHRPFSSKWLRWLNLVSIPVGILAVALTGSRTATISLAIALLYIVSLSRKARTGLRLLLVAGLVLGVYAVQELAPDLTVQRILGTVDSAVEGDYSYRDVIWAEGWDAFLEYPLVGVGAYAFDLNTPSGQAPHSVPVEVATELGMVGLVLFGTAMAFAAQAALRLRKQGEGIWLALLAVWIPGALTLTWTYQQITWLVLTLVVTAGASEETASSLQRPLRWSARQALDDDVLEPEVARPRRVRLVRKRPVRTGWDR